MQPTTAYLRERALDALQIAAGGVRNNTCDVVADEFASLVERDHENAEHQPRVRGATQSPVDGAKHFVALVAAADVADIEHEDGYVIVDPTIQQFEKRFDNDLPDVAILPPSDSRRSWYDRIEI